MNGNLDILIVTESKFPTFPKKQFYINGYAPPFRFDHTKNSGGVIIYVREDIPSKELTDHLSPINFEGIFFEINLKKRKWIVFGSCNPNKNSIRNYVNLLGPILDFYMAKYEKFLLLGDFNSEMKETTMIDFCKTYNLSNLIKEPTCFKNPHNPSTIDLILTNRLRMFLNSTTIETRLSDHHKLTITVTRSFFRSKHLLKKS